MMREGVERETYFQWLSQAAPHVQLHHLMAGYQISAAIHVAAELNLADLLAAGPQSSAALALECPQISSTDLDDLRLLAEGHEVKPILA